MMRRVCFLVPLLLFLSPASSRLWNYTFYSDMKTWSAAQAFCREHHTDLVTIRNEEDLAFLTVAKIWGWIGLYREDATSPWKWSRGDKIANFTAWQWYEPQPYGLCAYRLFQRWSTADCSNSYPFICYDNNVVLVKEEKTWEEALDHCRSLNGEGTDDPASSFWKHPYDLATLMTPEDHTDARETAQDASTEEVWTGLRYLAGDWLWVGGEQMQYKDIPKCPTDGSCGVLEKKGTAFFGIRDCQLRRNFLCYKKS